MVTLKNISTLDSFKEKNGDFIEFVSRAGDSIMLDFEQVYEFVVDNDVQDKTVLMYLRMAVELVNKLNGKGIEPITFETYNRKRHNLFDLNCFDSMISATELPLIQASNRNNQIYDFVKEYDIEMVKFNLTHLNEDGRPILIEDIGMRPNNFERLVRMVNFYDEHVIRLLEEEPHFSLHNNYLFYKDYSDKQLLIWHDEAYRDAIINYLFEHGENYIFGPLLDTQKQRIIEDAKDVTSKIKADKNYVVNQYHFYDDFPIYNPIKLKRTISQQLLDIVTKYVTRSEFKSDVVKTRVLDRFIVE